MKPTAGSPYPVRRHVQLSPGHAVRLRQLALRFGVTESELIRRLIDQEAERASDRPSSYWTSRPIYVGPTYIGPLKVGEDDETAEEPTP